MKVKVNDLSGLVLSLNVESTSTVLDIKNNIWSQTYVSVEQQNLLFNGQSLSDHSTVQGIGITRGKNLFLTTDLRNYYGGDDDDDDDDDETSETSSEAAEVAQKDNHQTTFKEIPNEPLCNEIIQIVEERKNNTVYSVRLKVKELDKELALANSCLKADSLEEKAAQYGEQALDVRKEAQEFAKAKKK